MNFAVVVDVPPIEASAAASVLSTCNAALGAQHCAIAGPEVTGHFYAVVRFAPNQSTVFTIELHDGDAAGTQVANSQLEFKDRDSERERWASAGVVVAALVAAQTEAISEPSAKPSTPKPAPVPVVARPVAVVRPPANEPHGPWLRLDLGATGGSENEHGAFRAGPLARLGLAFSELPVFALASAAYTVRASGTPDSTWFTGSLGFGVRIGFAQQRGALELRTEGVLESVSFHASDATRSQRARRTRYGPRLGLDLSGYLMKNLALVIGGEASALHPGVDISVGGQSVDRLPPFALGVHFFWSGTTFADCWSGPRSTSPEQHSGRFRAHAVAPDAPPCQTSIPDGRAETLAGPTGRRSRRNERGALGRAARVGLARGRGLGRNRTL